MSSGAFSQGLMLWLTRSLNGDVGMITLLNGWYALPTIHPNPGQDIPENIILKRSHSECGMHVILPTAPSIHRIWRYLNAHSGKGEFWMAQRYIQSLDQIGECRVFLVGETMCSIMHTYKMAGKNWKGDWAGTMMDTFLTLGEIRYISL